MDKKRVFGTGGELLVHQLVAALRRGVDAINAGEPYLVDVRVATVGAGADSTWHQRFKLWR